MDGEGDQRDQHEERLREVFQSFDGSGAGSLSPEELTELCHALQLADQALHRLLQALFQTEDQINTRVEFEQFKDALILVLSSSEETLATENPPRPVSPEVQPRFVKGTKRYGRRSTPEFTHSNSDLEHTSSVEREEEDATRTSDGTLPVKRERWNADVSSAEEYEAEGQLHLWNPDEPGTPRGNTAPLSDLEERLYSACQQLSLPLHGTATLQQLRTLCQHLDLEVEEEVFQSAHEKNVSVLEFVSCIHTNNKPPTPSASTPYRQLKRHHSTQPFDEMGRRISTAMSSTIGLRLFSELDDGTGHTAVELLLDAWLEDGVENSPEILQALDFNLERKVNLSELTAALENELMVTKNSILQAALASFKAEIRYLLERVDLELREKQKLQSDLEKAEKLKSQLASEVDEHHSAIERNNNLNLRKLEQEHKDRMVAMKAELSQEMELVQQQANQQREELELEINRVREDETFLREHLALTLKENGRLEAELLDSTERLMEVETQLNKLQKNLDNVLREKFGDLDLGNAEFYQQEERLRQLRKSYEEQCRELQDRIDELQAQLKEFRAVSHAPQTSLMPSLSDELDSKSPGMESDQGLGSEEGQPFNLSLEAEMMLEQLKEQHIRELEDIREHLDSTVKKCEHRLEEQKTSFEEERSLLSSQHQQEVKAMREELNKALERVRELQEQLEQDRHSMEAQHSAERAELHAVYQQQVDSLSQEVQDARIQALKLEEQLKLLEEQEESSARDKEELSKAHAEELRQMELHYMETLNTSLQKQKGEAEKTLTEELEKERQHLEEVHEKVLRVRLEELQQRAEQEQVELERRLREEWEGDKQQLEESNRKKLKEELELMQKEQEESKKRLIEQWEKEHVLLKEQHHTELQKCLQQERERLQVQEEDKERKMIEEWEKERVRLHEQHEGVLQASLEEQRAQFRTQGKEQEQTWQKMLEEHRVQMEHAHREAMEELSVKHCEEREMLSCMLEKLHADIAKERKEPEIHFAQRIHQVGSSFSGDLEVIMKHIQTDACNLEPRYQRKVVEFSQPHVANCVQWKAKLETQEAERQREFQQESKKEAIVTKLTQKPKRLELGYIIGMDGIPQLQSKLENIISIAEIEETVFSCELNKLHDRQQKNLKDKDTLLLQAENKSAKLELMLRQAMDDFRRQYHEILPFIKKQQQERCDLVKRFRRKLQEIDCLFHQAVEDFHTEYLRLQGTVLDLEEKLKNISVALEQEEKRVTLLAERDNLALKAHQTETCARDSITGQTMSDQIIQDLSWPDSSIEFVIVPQDNVIAEQPRDFRALVKENSPIAQHEEFKRSSFPQKEDAGNFKNPEHAKAQIIIGENLSCTEGNKTEDTLIRKDDHFTNTYTADPYSYEPLFIDIAEKTESTNKNSPSFVDSGVSNRSCLEETGPLVGEDLCENSAETSNKADAFKILEERTEEDTTTIVKTGYSYTTTSQHKVLAIEPMLQKEQEVIELGEYLRAIEILELQVIVVQFKYQSHLLELLQEQYRSTVKQNLSLQNQLVNMQQCNDQLELMLDLNKGKFPTSQTVLEEIHDLRVDLNALANNAIELEIKVLEFVELQAQYEKCVYENVQLAQQKMKLERRVEHLESKIHTAQEFQEQQSSLLNHIINMHKENARLSVAFHDQEQQDKMLLTLQEEAESIYEDSSDHSFKDHLGVNVFTLCEEGDLEFKKPNPYLQSVVTHLQEKFLRINMKIQEHRHEAGRLAEENLLLKQSISELREDDLKEKQQELLLKMEHFRKEKNTAQKMADGLKRQISELRRRRKQLEQENNALSQQNAKHAVGVDAHQHNLEEMMLHHGNCPFNERNEIEEGDFAASHSRTERLDEKKLLRAELNHCVEKMAQLRSAETQLAQVLQERQMADKHNQALRTQMIKAQEKVQAVNLTLQELTQQNSRLKSDLRITQQERDTLKQEVISLHKQLQNANEKCRLAEMSVSSISGSSHQGKRVWPELSRLMEAELNMLREENQRLQREISDARLELSSAYEKTRQLEALVLSVKQQKLQNQARLAKTAEQERSALRREIEALHIQLHSKSCDHKEEQREFEKLHEENERLRNKQTIIEAQLIEAQLLAILPPSPMRMSVERRGQPRGDDMNPEINKEQEVALLKMEERMKEVEHTLRNVKLLLQEKVSQLKEQMNKNSKADVLIKDLYVENAHLLKALEVSEQRQKVTEKKNYLLEEKISSLNKIVRELSPSPLMPVPYHVTRS